MLHKSSNVKFLSSLVILAGLLVSLAVPLKSRVSAAAGQTDSAPVSADGLKPADYGKMPLLFEANHGQTAGQVKFIARSGGYTLYLSRTQAAFSLKIPADQAEEQLQNRKFVKRQKTHSDNLMMRFAGANPQTAVEGVDEAVTRTNYYIGQKRLENLPNFRRVKYAGLYSGIDAVFYGNETDQLEYDFVVAPNAVPDQIRLNFDGAESLAVDENGALLIKTENTELVQPKPFAYQEIGGERREVSCQWSVAGGQSENNRQIAFALGEYDRTQPLVIDPAVKYLTYIGGTNFDEIQGVAADPDGNAYIAGDTNSLDFPSSRVSSDDVGIFVAKIDPTGSQFQYITVLEGEDSDFATSIAADAGGNAYITGFSDSNQFPTTSNAYQKRRSLCNWVLTPIQCATLNDDVIVAKLDSNGQISYATYLGGQRTDQGSGIAVDSAGKAYVVGVTSSGLTFPKKNEFQGTGVFGVSNDAFLTVFNAAGSDIVYSTGFGGNGDDGANGIALDSANNAYITGFTSSSGSFPTEAPAQAANGGGTDAFVAKFNPALSGNDSLIYSTFLGGSGTEFGHAIAVSPTGTASVTGVTGSLNFPLKNAFDTTNQVNEAFVTQYGSTGALLNSSFLGGADQDQGNAIALGNGGTIYITGSTLSNNFPTALPFQATRRGLRDAFVAKIRFGVNSNPGVASASYLGGNGNDFGSSIAVRGNFIFVAGETESNNLATTGGVIKPTSNAGSTIPDGFVAKILDTHKDTIGTFDPAGSVFGLKNTLAGGRPNITVLRGVAGDTGVSGDFNGDGRDTVSTFNNGTWKIFGFNVIVSGYPTPATTANFGLAGDLPVVGDWDGDGVETIGAFRPSTGQFFLSNSNTTPAINFQVNFGTNGDLPVAGDWDGDGIDTVGVFRPSEGTFFLTNRNVVNASIDQVAFFGINGDLPIAGDWDGNGVVTIGVWRPATREFFLSNDNVNISDTIIFGGFGDTPVAGDWDGLPN